jgi:hypothetical protein
MLTFCANPHPDAAHLRDAAAVADWHSTVPCALRHGLGPLLYWQLARACPEAVPPEALLFLRECFEANAARNLHLTRELLNLLDLFERAAIPVVAFKGIVLAWSLYGNPALRRVGDLDLLVRPPDLLRAREMLVSAGYRCPYPDDLRLFRLGRQIPLVSKSAVVADLHWSLAPSWLCYGLDTDAVWTRLNTVQIAGREVRTLAPEDLLLFLCVHGAKHSWCSLDLLADLARLIERGQLDWDRVIARASSRRISRMVFSGLLLAVDLLGIDLPAPVIAQLRVHPSASALAAWSRERLLQPSPPPLSKRQELSLQLRLLERASDKLRFCWAQFAPAVRDAECHALPAPLFPLYYVFRPLRLLAKYAVPRAATRRFASVDPQLTHNVPPPRQVRRPRRRCVR